MFNNIVNRRDFSDLFHKAPSLLVRFCKSSLLVNKNRVKLAWSHVDANPTNWWDIPAVRLRWNRLIAGSADIDFHTYISQRWLSRRTDLMGLSLGCGTGHNEIAWAALGNFKRIDAYDISPQRIDVAVSVASERGYADLTRFSVGDVFGIDAPDSHYDIIMVEQSLHHFSPLEKILFHVDRLLKDDGYFIVNEFVGPTRFQWTKRQLDAVNGLMSAIPEKYRTLWDGRQIKPPVVRPSHLRMLVTDPSEAVESAQIVPLLRSMFDVVEFRGYGGSILHLLFNGIAHNFLQEDSETAELLEMIFKFEDILLQSQDIQHDFIVAVCKKRQCF